MNHSRIILAVFAAALVAGCESPQQQKQRWPWEEKQIPVTAPKEQVKLPPPASAPAVATRPVRPAASAPVRPATGPVAITARPTTQVSGGPVRAPLLLTDLPDVPTPPLPPPPPPVPTADPNAPAIPRVPRTRPAPPPTPAPTPPPPTEVVSALGLQVNNKYITVEDILRSAAGELAELPRGLSLQTFHEQADRILQQAVRGQIETAAVLPEAEARITEDETKKIDEEMDKTLRAMVAEVGGSRTQLEQIWIRRGTTLDQVLKEQRGRLLVTRYLQSKILPDISITRRMLYDYYQKHKADRYTQKKKVQMQILAVPVSVFLLREQPTPAERDAAKAEARKAIDPAERALRDGRDFTETVKNFGRDSRAAQGGVWPIMEAGSYREGKVEQAAFALRAGQASGVIEADSGFYVVKALKIEGGTVVSFEDAQEDIEKALSDEQYMKLREKYVLAKWPSVAASNRLGELAMEKAIERYWKK
jgi:peptidyl-prolyl cis-trans isomerase SurA